MEYIRGGETMTDICTIGPVSVENAHIFDSNTFEFSNSAERVVSSGSTITTKGQYQEAYEFEIICTYEDALQLKGVVEMGEMIWMNTSDLTDNDFLQHKGWVILTSLTIELENPTQLVSCQIQYHKISDHEAEYLTMDYSRGIYDGINLVPDYDISATSYTLQDDGSDITTNWSTAARYPASGTNTAVTDGAEFDLTSASAVDGRWQNTWIRCDTKKFTPPFTFETVLDYNTLPGAASYPASLGVLFSSQYVLSGNIEFNNKRYGDYLEAQWNLSNTLTSLHLASFSRGTTFGAKRYMRSNINEGTTHAELGLKMQFYADGKVRISTDLDTTGTWTQIYYGPSNLINYKKGLYLYLYVKNRDSTSYTGSFHKVEVYNSNATTFPNVVMTPPDAVLSTAATGTRTVEDGTASYYTNPTTELRYLIDKAKYYQGSVKLLSTNNTGADSLQVFSTGYKLTPATTTLKNGMTQLRFDADEVIISGWDSAAYQEINRIHFVDDIDFIRPLFINSERVVLQINDTKWTMLRSSRVVTVEHPNTVLQYTIKDRYTTGSGTTSSPAADADVAMTADGDYYMTVYDTAADTYQLLIGKKDPCTIKSDSLPVDTVTGIGWYKKADAGIDAADSLIQQWYKQTRTGIRLKQII